MIATDFSYDGESLSDLGYLVCEFEEDTGFSESIEFSTIEISTVSSYRGRKHYKTGASYDSTVSLEFGICKNPDRFPPEEKYFTDEEVRHLMRWLNRNEFHEFCLFDYKDTYDNIHFNCTFNIKLVRHGGKTAGLKLRMISDAPYGYGDEISYEMDFSRITNYYISDINDEEGITYPVTSIIVGEDGYLKLENESTGTLTYIKNCTAGETITFSGWTRIISSDNDDHDLANDFNYGYPTIGNTYQNRFNKIKCNLGSTVTMTYRPIIKNLP